MEEQQPDGNQFVGKYSDQDISLESERNQERRVLFLDVGKLYRTEPIYNKDANTKKESNPNKFGGCKNDGIAIVI